MIKLPQMGMLYLLTISVIINAALIRPRVEGAHGVPPKMRDVETKYRIPLGQKQFKLVCPVIVSNIDNTMIQWSKNGEQLDWDSSYKLSKDGTELKMKFVKFEDSGRYQCQATNGFGHKTIEFIVHVHDQNDRGNSVKDYLVLSNTTASPSWLTDMNSEWRSPIKVNVGGKLELRCPAQGNPLPEIRWYQNELQISEKTHKHVSSIVIDPADASHTGSYRCVIENTLGSLTFAFDVSVGEYFDPPTTDTSFYQEPNGEPVVDQPVNITVEAGHTAQFQCNVTSPENTLIKWLKEVKDPEAYKKSDPSAAIINAYGMHLLVLDHILTETIMSQTAENAFINRLTIPKARMDHAGKYICVVTNAQGHIVHKSAELIVRPSNTFALYVPADLVIFIVLSILFLVALVLIFKGISWLRAIRESTSDSISKPPPPPRMPPPAAPTDEWSIGQTIHSNKPLLLHNSMFHQPNSNMKYHAATMDRNNIIRVERRFDEMSNVYDNTTTVQPYYTQQRNNNSIYNGGYRTLEVYNHHRTYQPSDEYSDNDGFYHKR